MKKLISCTAIAFSAFTFAQTNPNLELKIKNYSAKIDSIVTAEKSKMNRELDDFEANSKNVSAEEKSKKRLEIASKYENSINEKVNSEKENLEEITQQSVKDAVAGKNSDNYNNRVAVMIGTNSAIEINSGKKSARDFLKTDGITYNLNFQTLTNNASSLDLFHNNSNIKTSLSSGSVLYKAVRQLGKFTSPFFINYGIGWTGNEYALEKPLVFAQGKGRIFTTEFNDGNLKRSKISLNYLEIPVDFQWVLNPKYIEEDGEKYLSMKRQFRIGVGLYGQYKIGGRIQIDYSNDESSKNIFRQRVENGVNRAVLGAKFSIGYGGFNFFIKKDLTPAFNKDAVLHDKYGVSVGMTIANLNL